MSVRWLDARMDLELRCNYRCQYCYNRPDSWRGAKTSFTLEELDTIFTSLARSCWSVYLSCAGEPFMFAGVDDALRRTAKILAGCDVSLVTNGSLMNAERRAAVLESAVSRVFVSIDTIDPQLYARLCGCGAGALDTVKDNIRALIRERGARRWPRVFITAIVMKSTFGRLPELAAWAAGAGVSGIKAQWLRTDYCPQFEGESIGPSHAVIAALRETASVCRANGLSYEHPIRTDWAKLRSIAGGIRDIRHPGGYLLSTWHKTAAVFHRGACRAAGNTFWISGTGDISTCQRDQTPLANLLREPDIDIARVIGQAAAVIRKSAAGCAGCHYVRGV